MEKVHNTMDLDLSAAARGVWLVKVPKYLSEKWKHTDSSGEVGKLRISNPRFPGGKPEVVFSLSNELAAQEQVAETPVPKDHKFVLTGIANQSMGVLSETISADHDHDPSASSTEAVSVVGKVIQRAECRPMADANYMNLKRKHVEETNKPKREVKQLDRVVQNFKPKATHAFLAEHEKRKKEEGKNTRADKDAVMNMLFSAFEKHQYYNIKDLVTITKQPYPYLKEILKEIAVYNMKNPHKNMWELKSEYRHYKEQT